VHLSSSEHPQCVTFWSEEQTDPRRAAISAFVSDATQVKIQMYVESGYCFSQCPALRKGENLTGTVVPVWEICHIYHQDMSTVVPRVAVAQHCP